ncbi:DUF3107 domain-containing protein [Actinoalloteichus hymeniacidonis]|uniref:DUF3107 family protein n=1 Tax=Actinoalloteichus hymeniacidonis TaxID=340345 RepID=A0AAC9MX18_9PSEU|nr:DUF3107 domain-containing protein [Actinoalloteichus hymeniacidonis]AOS61784.1 putative DUF3107 family protein [Actinoalloteichus hymeniacidonis]MBB5910197.1 hypothetical protein [Actinoalloteichus hymeniacidonis]
MEVKIGVADSSRELVLTSSQSPDEVEKLITEALGDKRTLLTLSDEKGRRYMVPTERIAYVEIGPSDARRVGFAISG